MVLWTVTVAVVVLVYVVLPDEAPSIWRAGFTFGALIELFVYLVGGLAAVVVFLVSFFSGLAYLTTVLAAWKSSNWVLRAADDGLYIKFRAYTDHRLPASDEVVLHLPKRDIRWLRQHGLQVRHPPRAGTGTGTSEDDSAIAHHQFLAIAVDEEVAEALARRMAEERRRWTPSLLPGVKQKSTGAPVRIQPDGLIRIDWKTRATRLSPPLSTFADRLQGGYRWAEEVERAQEEIRALSHEDQKARLKDMAERGDGLDAVILAKGLYGLSTSDAKALIDELIEK